MDRSRTTCPSRPRGGFTLVELLVVIGIIALLISILLPALNSARKQADRVKCLSNMRSLGQAYMMYSVENQGYFPPAKWNYFSPTGAAREKRWHDFIGKYIVGKVGVMISGQMVQGDINPNGTQALSERQIFSPEIREGNNAIWGCNTWRRASYSSNSVVSESAQNWHVGYAQNLYFGYPTTTKNTYVSSNNTGTITAGVWAKQNQYTRPADRGLLVESVHSNLAAPLNWTWAPDTSTPFLKQPDVNVNVGFSIDFNRHGKRPIGNTPSDPSLNLLYADGHAGYIGARDAYRAIRFR